MDKVIILGGHQLVLGTCELCGTEGEELRPYGPNGERICFDCGMKDEQMTSKRFQQVVFKEGFDA